MQTFEINLSLVLAHSMMLETKAKYSPNGIVDDARNDEGNDQDPLQLSASQLAAFTMFGPQSAQIYKDHFLPLSADAAKWNAQAYVDNAAKVNDVGRNIYNKNAANQVNLDNKLVNSRAAEGAVTGANRLQQIVDPEFFAGRKLLLGGVKDIFGDIDNVQSQALLPESGQLLSGSEVAEMERGLNRFNGSTNPMSALTTASNAMQFGQAGRDRLMENRAENRATQAFKPGLLSQAITAASGALPAMRTGMDAYKIATGKSAATNFGQPVESQDKNTFGNSVFGQYGDFSRSAFETSANNKEGITGQLPSYS